MPRIGPQLGSSFGVQYDLRPAKQVERRMIIDACQLLSLANFPIRDYQYTGFGSFYFVDFILFHKLLGIRDMLSVERDTRIEKRVKYNRPFACIKLEMNSSTVVIPTLSPDKKHILWLDYDSVLSASHIIDARLAGTYLTPGSLILITVDVEPPGDEQDGPKQWRQHFHEEAGELALSLDRDDDFAESKLVSVNSKLLASAIHAGMVGRDVQFSPLFNFLYADGHHMLTIGGMITTETERRQLRASKLDATEYIRTSLSKKPFSIYVPRVTRKKRLHLDPRMPCRKKWRPKRFEMPSRDVQAYRQVFPFLPAYAELLL
jgi:putative O-methyltransferase